MRRTILNDILTPVEAFDLFPHKKRDPRGVAKELLMTIRRAHIRPAKPAPGAMRVPRPRLG